MHRYVRRVFLPVGGLAFLPAWVAAQEATFTGKVSTEAGAPIASAQVYIDRMGVGATTNDDGNYRFVVPAARVQGQAATLIAQVIGYKQQSVPVTITPGAHENNFTMTAVATVLSRVVVTGEGTVTTEAKLGNRVDQVPATEIIKSNEPNVTEALAGKAPNVEVQQQSGDAGGSVSVQIRGLKSFIGTGQPLFVVDGIPLDNSTITTNESDASTVAPNRISDLNPNDIESVNILKGAAAAAIYGSRAAQGVVLITTKSGRSGPTRYSLRSSYSFDKVTQGYSLQQRFGQGDEGLPFLCPFDPSDLDCTLGGRSWGPALVPSTYIDSMASPNGFDISTDSATVLFNNRFPNGIQTFDHFHEMFETGHVFDNTLSISGGDDRRTFFLSGGRNANRGFIAGDNDSYDRTTLRLKGTQALTDRFRIGGNLAYVDTRGHFVQRGNNVSGIMLTGVRTAPEFNNLPYLDPVTGLHRSYRFPHPSPTSQTTNRIFDNPFFAINEDPAVSSLGRVYGTVDLDYNPVEWISLKYTGGGDYWSDYRNEGISQSDGTRPDGQVTAGTLTNYILDHNLIAVANHTFSDKLAGSLTLGQNLSTENYKENLVTGTTLIAPRPFRLLNTASYTPTDTERVVHLRSYFGQVTTDLYDQLHLTAALRNDASSAFAQNSNSHWYPKASAAWEVNKVIGDLGGHLDFAKLRFSYGVAGKAPEPYTTLTIFNEGIVNSSYDGTYFNKAFFNSVPGEVSNSRIGNNNLRPERTREFEGGVDFGLFKNFTDLSLTYYAQKTTDVIFLAPIPPSSGAWQQVKNAATVQNKGFEVAWNLRPVQAQNVAWDIGLQWSRNRNKVLDIQGADEVSLGNFLLQTAVARPGFPIGSFETQDFVRCRLHDPDESNTFSGVNINQLCRDSGAKDGAYYIDDGTLGGDPGFPVVDPTLRLVGSPEPKWRGSVRTSLTFAKRLQVSTLIDIKHGGSGYDGTLGALHDYGRHSDTEIRDKCPCVFGPSTNGYLSYFTQNVVGPGVGTPVTVGQDWFEANGGAFNGPNAQFIEDAGFTKLREISVAYTFDQRFVKENLGLSSIELRLSGRNLHTWTRYRGVDPENSLNGATEAIQGVDWFNNPQSRSFVISLGLNR